MRISKGVHYRRFDEQVFIRDSFREQEYILNDSAGELLDYFRNHPGASQTEMCHHMEELFGCMEAGRDMWEFAEYLRERGILSYENQQEYFSERNECGNEEFNKDGFIQEDRNEDSLSDIYRNYCIHNHMIYTACLELTYRCNERCIHCYMDGEGYGDTDERKELSLEEYQFLIDQLWDLGCSSLLLTGGEVCLRRDYLDIAEYASKKGMYVDIYSNGISMKDEDFTRVRELMPNSFSFSLYGGTPTVHDAVTKVQGSFERTLNSAIRMKNAGVPTYLKAVVIKQNAADMEELLKLGKRFNIRVILSYMIAPGWGGKDADEFRLGDSSAYLKVMRMEAGYRTFYLSPAEKTAEFPICSCGRDFISVSPFGDVYPCINVRDCMGNIREKPLEQIWNSERSLAYSRLRCSDLGCDREHCGDKEFCLVCLGHVTWQNGKAKPPRESCRLAAAYRKLYEEQSLGVVE